MKLAEYLFWKFWKFRAKKEQDMDSAYFFATMFFGFLIFFFPSLLILKNFGALLDLQKNKTLQYALIVPIIFLCSLPIRLIFRKKRIFSLEYSDLDKNRYNNKLFLLLLITFFLIFLRVYFMKKI
jgi:hypothetical protein